MNKTKRPAPQARRQRHKGRPGRPSKYTPASVRKICGALADGLPFKYAAALGGISHETLAEWRRQFPAFSERIRGAVARGILARLKLLKKAADAGDVSCCKWWLEHVLPEHYSKTRLEVSGPDGNALNMGSGPNIYLPQKGSLPGEVPFGLDLTPEELHAFAGKGELDPAVLRRMLALAELPDGSTIQRKGDTFISTDPKEPIDTAGLQAVARKLFGLPATAQGTVARWLDINNRQVPNANTPAAPQPAAPPALAAPVLEPATKPPPAAQPAPAKPTPAPERPVGRSISETDLMGSEAERREQAEIRAAPFRRPLNHNRRNPWL